MKRVDDFRLRLGKQELVPIMVGGMGVDISTAELALEVARLGGIGHISDAMVPTVSDRRFNTKYVKNKLRQYKFNVANSEKAVVKFDLGLLAEATALHVGRTMEAKRGDGHDLHQLHGKADHERPQGNPARPSQGGIGRGHRRRHPGGRPAPRLVRR
jgi:hypothetical protein